MWIWSLHLPSREIVNKLGELLEDIIWEQLSPVNITQVLRNLRSIVTSHVFGQVVLSIRQPVLV